MALITLSPGTRPFLSGGLGRVHCLKGRDPTVLFFLPYLSSFLSLLLLVLSAQGPCQDLSSSPQPRLLMSQERGVGGPSPSSRDQALLGAQSPRLDIAIGSARRRGDD